jgi:DNA-binding winged helix-turn-helix (wHTH) protein
MRAQNTSRRTLDRTESAFVATDLRALEPRSASIHLLNSSTRAGAHPGTDRSTRVPPTSRNEMAELVVDVDGSPVLVRFLVEMQSDSISKDADMDSLLSRTLETMVDRMRGSCPRNDSEVLCVGPLQLDLLDRTAKRGDRQIDLRPREFRLLRYMMERSDKLLTRATLLKEVWNYKFVPETNLVDVHMGRLRRKVDGPNDAPLIRNVRGAGFVLSAIPCSHGSLSSPTERSANPPRTFFQHAQHAS